MTGHTTRHFIETFLLVVALAFNGILGASAAFSETGDHSAAIDLGEVHQADASVDAERLFKNLPAQYQTVFPPDERLRVTPTTSFPASAVSLVVTGDPNGVVAACTGTFIGPQVVLTAAHCLYNSVWGGWAPQFVVAPGNDGNYHPFGIIDGNFEWVPAGWANGYDSSWD